MDLARTIEGRTERTRHRLGGALIALVQEKPFDSITVQDVLDRADVSRATFYTHFRDQDDLFLSQVDEFLDWMANVLDRSGDTSPRVAPVRELFAHVGEEGRRLYQALQESGRAQDFLDLAQGHFARAIEARLDRAHGRDPGRAANGSKAGARTPDPAAERRAARGQALAGALLSLLTWWLERDSTLTAQDMDDLFHEIVGGSAGRDAS